jgi:hypothetical protein
MGGAAVPRVSLRSTLGYLISPLWGWSRERPSAFGHAAWSRVGPFNISRFNRRSALGPGAPTGHYEIAQGNALGIGANEEWSPERAKCCPGVFGRPAIGFRPFRAPNQWGVSWYPGCRFALPWAISFRPFGAGEGNAARDSRCIAWSRAGPFNMPRFNRRSVSRSGAPTGHKEIAQGSALGPGPSEEWSPERAKCCPGVFGRPAIGFRPFRAPNQWGVSWYPGCRFALPWAISSRPFGAGECRVMPQSTVGGRRRNLTGKQLR